MAVPPLAEIPRSVRLPTVPPSTATEPPDGVANADGVAGIAAAVDVADGDRAATGRRRRHPAVAGGGDVAGACIPATKELALEVPEARLG